MTDVEFLEPPGGPAGAPAQAAPAGPPDGPDTPVPPRAWPVTFWLIGAACALAAPFTHLYGVRSGSDAGYEQYVDGWGRLEVSVDAPDTPGHDVAYGVVYVAAAAVLAALVVLTVLPAVRDARPRPGLAAALRPAAAAVAGLLAGVTAVVALAIEALVSRVHPSAAAAGLGEGGLQATPTVLVGPMVWLSLAAAVAAGLGALLQVRPVPAALRRRPPAVRDRGTETDTDTDPAPSRDELLD